VDQFYFESGYIEDKYFVYVAAGASALSSTATVTVTAGKILGTTVNFTGVFATTMTVNAVKNGGIVVTAAFTQSATPVANRSISLTLANIANLASQADKLHSTASSSMAVAFALTADAADVIQAQATFPAVTSSIFTSRYFGGPRPRQGTRNGSSYNDAVYTEPIIADFGGSVGRFSTGLVYTSEPYRDWNIQANQDFVIEFWVKISNAFAFGVTQVHLAGVGQFTGGYNQTSLSTTEDAWSIGAYYSGSFPVGSYVNFRYNDNGTIRTLTAPSSSGNIPDGTWTHVAVTRTGSSLRIFTNNTQRTSTTFSGAIRAPNTITNNRLKFYGVDNTTSGTRITYYDEFSWRRNTSTIAGYTSVIKNDDDNQVILLHFDTGQNLSATTDDIRTTFSIASNQSSVFTQTASAIITKSASATLSAAFTQTADALSLKEANADLATTVALTAQGDKLVEATANFSVTVTQTADNTRTRPFDSTLSAVFDDIIAIGAIRTSSSSQLVAFESNITINANKVGETQLQTTATMSVTAEKTAGLFSDVNAAFTQTTAVTRARSFDSSLNATFTATIVGSKLLEAASDLASTFTQTTDADKFRAFSIDLSATVNQTAVGVKTADAVSNQNSTVTQTTDVLKFVGLEAAFSSAFTQTTLVERIKSFDAGIAATTDTAISAVKTATADSTQSSAFAQSALAVKTVDVVVQEDVIASQVSAFGIIANKESQLSATTSLAAVIGKLVEFPANDTWLHTGVSSYTYDKYPRVLMSFDRGVFDQIPVSEDGFTLSIWTKRDTLAVDEFQPIVSTSQNWGAFTFYNDDIVIRQNFDPDEPNPTWQEVSTDTDWHHYLFYTTRKGDTSPGATPYYRLWIDGEYQGERTYNAYNESVQFASGEYLKLGSALLANLNIPYASEGYGADSGFAQVWLGKISSSSGANWSPPVNYFYDLGYVDLDTDGRGEGDRLPLPFVYNTLDDPWIGVEFLPTVNEYYTEDQKPASEYLTSPWQSYFRFRAKTEGVFLYTASLAADTALTATGFRTLELASTQTVTTDQQTLIGVIKPAASELSAETTQTTSAVKTANGQSDLSVSASVFAEIGDLDSAQATLSAAFELECQAVIIDPTRASALLQSAFTVSANIDVIVNNTVTATSAFTLSADVTVIPPVRVEANLQVTASLSATIGSIEQFAVLVMSAGTMTTQAQALKDAFVNMPCVSSQTAQAQRQFRSTTANLSVTGFQLTAGDIINLDPALTLTVKPESRLLTILPESRVYEVQGETRTLIIIKG